MVLESGLGLTDIVKDSYTSNDKNLTKNDYSIPIKAFNEKIKKYKPRFVCFNGMNAYQIFFGRNSSIFGLLLNRIYYSQVYIVPSTSGRVRSDKLYKGKTRLEWFMELGQLLKSDGFA